MSIMRERTMSLFEEFNEEERVNKDTKFTDLIPPYIYTPSDNCPHILSLVDRRKTLRLIAEIESADISEEEKKFLIEAAHRHSVFNYSLIADYYAHASQQVQQLMEKSALVIIDYDKAIENGYVSLSAKLREIQDNTGESTL